LRKELDRLELFVRRVQPLPSASPLPLDGLADDSGEPRDREPLRHWTDEVSRGRRGRRDERRE
jgi:hypothetical protein